MAGKVTQRPDHPQGCIPRAMERSCRVSEGEFRRALTLTLVVLALLPGGTSGLVPSPPKRTALASSPKLRGNLRGGDGLLCLRARLVSGCASQLPNCS